MENKGREAQPVTKESFFAFAVQKLGRKFTDKERRGLQRLLKVYSSSDIQGYFLQVVYYRENEYAGMPLADSVEAVHENIEDLIDMDEDIIKEADRKERKLASLKEAIRKSPDIFVNSEDQG